MHSARALTLTLALSLVVTGAACSAPTEESDGDSSTAAFSMASDEFTSLLRDAEKVEADCRARGKCAATDDDTTTDDTVKPKTVDILVGGARAWNNRRASSFSLCEAIAPFRFLNNPYFFAGATVKAAAVKTLADGGVDIVFDLKNKQAALFTYKNHGVQNLIGAEASVYAGWAFGKKTSVIDAWSGEFVAAEATVEVPILKLAAGGFIFRSPDKSLWGGALEASIGLNLIPAHLEVGVSEGHWTPWDKGTTWYGEHLWSVRYDEKTAPFHDKPYGLIQFRGARDTVVALLQTFGPLLGAPAAAYVSAVAALGKAGLSMERACPTMPGAAREDH